MTDEHDLITQYFKEYSVLHEQQEELLAQIWEINRKYHSLEQRIEEFDRLFYPYWQHRKDREKGGKP